MSEQNSITKKDKIEAIDWLIETFPAAFFKKSNTILPLKIGILNDIIVFYDHLTNPPFSKQILREALQYYTSSHGYLSAQTINQARVDLYGNEVDEVTEEQARYAFKRQKAKAVMATIGKQPNNS